VQNSGIKYALQGFIDGLKNQLEYSNKTSKTLMRDINKFVEMNLIKITEEGISAKKETILAFLPRRISN
jgi:hypothetical protein